ncbi:MAG: UDP-glucose 6-dehydrogenase, partial [uncultured Gemmatimonadetes bacterium]
AHRSRRDGLRGSGGGRLPRRDGERRGLRRHRRPQDRAPERGRDPHLRAGAGAAGGAQPQGGPAALHHRRGGHRGRGRGGLHRRGHPSGRGRQRGPAARAGRGRDGGAQHARRRAGEDRHHQEHRARGHRQQGARGDRPAHGPAVPRLLQPRVPEGRGRRAGLHAPRPRGGGRGQRARAQPPGGAVRALRAHRQPGAVHGHRLGRDHQVRGQRHAGHAHLVHEHGGGPLRGRGRKRVARAAGDRHGRAHRARVPVRGDRLRRLVLSQGREGAGAHAARNGGGPGDPGGRGAGERFAEAPAGVARAGALRGRPFRQVLRRVGAVVQAGDGRHARGALAHRGARSVRARGHRAGARPRGAPRGRPLLRGPHRDGRAVALRAQLRLPERGGRAAGAHGVGPLPHPRFRAHPRHPGRAGGVRRAQPVGPGAHGRDGLPLRVGRPPHGGAGRRGVAL